MTADMAAKDTALETDCLNAETASLVAMPFSGVITTNADANRVSKEADDWAKEMVLHKIRFDEFVAAARSVWDGRNERRKTFLERYKKAIDTRKKAVEQFYLEETKRREQAQRDADETAKQQALLVAEASGDTRRVREIESGKIPISSAVVIAEPVTIKGMSIKMVKVGRVVDMDAFVKACAKGQYGLTFTVLEVNDKLFQQWVRATNGTVPIAGVTYSDEVDTRRTGRV